MANTRTAVINQYKRASISLLCKALLYAALTIIGFVFLYPFLYMIAQSVMSYEDIVDATVEWIPREFSFSNYSVAYSALSVSATLKNSIFLTAICTVGHLFVCSIIGYGFARFPYKGSNLIFGGVVLSMLIPIQTLIIPRYIFFSKLEVIFGLPMTEGYLPMILPCFLGFGLYGGLYIFLFRQFFIRMPKSLEEAAYIDGCGPLRAFFTIALPTAGPTITVSLVLSIVWHGNDYYEPSVFLVEPKQWLLPQVLPELYNRLMSTQVSDTSKINESILYHEGVVMAATVIALVPLMIVYLILQRRFMESIERSGLVE